MDAGDDRVTLVGADIQLAGSHTDPDAGDTHDYAWDLGDGNAATGTDPIHIYADHGRYTHPVTHISAKSCLNEKPL